MRRNFIVLEEIRAGLTDSTFEEIEAKRHLDALAWYLAEHDRKAQYKPDSLD